MLPAPIADLPATRGVEGRASGSDSGIANRRPAVALILILLLLPFGGGAFVLTENLLLVILIVVLVLAVGGYGTRSRW